MASEFFKKTFKSMNEEDKEKCNKEQTAYFNEYRKKIMGAIGDKKLKFLSTLVEEEKP